MTQQPKPKIEDSQENKNSQGSQKPGLISSFSSFFTKNKKLSFLIIIIMMIAGMFSTMSMKREAFPSTAVNLLLVETDYPGASPEQVKQEITIPLENTAKSVESFESVVSTSLNGKSILQVTYEYGYDMDRAKQELTTEVRSVSLPENADIPEVQEIDVAKYGDGYDLIYNIYTKDESLNEKELFNQAKIITDKFEEISNIERADIRGQIEFQTIIKIKKEYIDQGITPPFLAEYLKSRNVELSSGAMGQLPISVVSDISSLEKLENFEIVFNNRNFKLSEIADFSEEVAEKSRIINFYGKKESGNLERYNAVQLGIAKKNSADIIDTSEQLRQAFDELKDENLILDSIKIDYSIDSSDDIKQQISDLRLSAIQGLIVVMIVIYLMVSIRGSLIMLIFIPTVILGTLTVLYLIGYTINVIVLFALILALGLLVDDGVVIVQSINEELKRGKSKKQAVIDAINSVGTADISGSITTILVFFPMLAISGILGDIIKYIPVTLIIVLLISIFLGLTVVPYLSIRILSEKKYDSKSGKKQEVLDELDKSQEPEWVKKIYDFSHWSVSKWWKQLLTVGVVLMIFVSSIGIAMSGKVGFSLFPSSDDSEMIMINYNKSDNISYQENLDNVNQILEVLKTQEEYISDYSMFLEQGMIIVNLEDAEGTFISNLVSLRKAGDRTKTATEIAENFNEKIEEINKNFREERGIDDKSVRTLKVEAQVSSEGPPGSEYPVQFQVYGQDLDKMKNLASDMKSYIMSEEFRENVNDIMKKERELDENDELEKEFRLPKVDFVLSSGESTEFEIPKFVLNDYAKQTLGIDPQIINQTISANINTFSAGEIMTSEIKIESENKNNQKIPDLLNLEIQTPEGPKKLSELGKFENRKTLTNIRRRNSQDFLSIQVAFEYNDDVENLSGEMISAIEKEIFGQEDQDGNWEYEGKFNEEVLVEKYDLKKDALGANRGADEQNEEDFASVGPAFLLAIFMMYLVLTIQFNSFIKPVIILLAVPYGITGVIYGLFITGNPFSFFAAIGVMALSGIVVNNTIMIIEYSAKLKKEKNLRARDSIAEAVRLRIKPILATMTTTIMSMLPLALSQPFWEGLAYSMVFGLIFSTFMSIVSVPVVYLWFDRLERVPKYLKNKYFSK